MDVVEAVARLGNESQILVPKIMGPSASPDMSGFAGQFGVAGAYVEAPSDVA